MVSTGFSITTAHAQLPAPKGPVEQKYRAQGPWVSVSKTVSPAVCDRENNLCDIWYPTSLGANPIKGLSSGFKHPVVVWANGTGQVPAKYEYYLRHLASWGFIVIASRDTGTGTGGTTVDAANYIIARGNSTGDIFSGKVDAANVGASGHSQGGSTILKLASNNTAPFKAFVPVHSVAGLFGLLCCGLLNGNMGSTPATKSILILGGTGDNDNASENRSFYTATANVATKAVGIINGAQHDDILGQPGCGGVSRCTHGTYPYQGYAAAWLMWKLQGATDVQAAFAPSGEFRQANPGWNFNDSNVP
jgi:dienelactone hydrolase